MLLNKYYGLRHDVWGLGILCYYLFCGKFPFSLDKIDKISKQISSRKSQQFDLKSNLSSMNNLNSKIKIDLDDPKSPIGSPKGKKSTKSISKFRKSRTRTDSKRNGSKSVSKTIKRGITSIDDTRKTFNFDEKTEENEDEKNILKNGKESLKEAKKSKDFKDKKSIGSRNLENSAAQSQIVGADFTKDEIETKENILNKEPNWDLLQRRCQDKEIVEMIKGMLKKNPSERSTIRQVINSPPMKKFKQKLLKEV